MDFPERAAQSVSFLPALIKSEFDCEYVEEDLSEHSPPTGINGCDKPLFEGSVNLDIPSKQEQSGLDDTCQIARKVTEELRLHGIPQAVFSKIVLARSQGTLSDLLRRPKPWSKLKSGRDTFLRMWRWLQEPEISRITNLRLAKDLLRTPYSSELLEPKKSRPVFTAPQRYALHAMFRKTKRPNKEMQITIARQLNLGISSVANFFMNMRRRSIEKWKDDISGIETPHD